MGSGACDTDYQIDSSPSPLMIISILVLLLWSATTNVPQQHNVKGIVRDARSDSALFGATVSLPNGQRVAVTDKRGRFQVDLPKIGWPPALVVSAPGHAARSVPLPHIPADADLKVVTLTVAARLHVTVPAAFSGDKLRWRLVRLMGGRPIEPIQEGSFATGKTEAIIDGLPAANCLLLIRGEEPLQQKGVEISTREGETTELPINIAPMLLKLTVESGDRIQGGAIVRFIQPDQRWVGTVACDENGTASEEMWQSGDYFVALTDHGRMSFTRVAHLQSDTGTISWTFNVPAHRVKGRVLDSMTREPLQGVQLTLEGTAPREGGLEGLNTSTAGDGSFEFRAVQEGQHSLRPYLKGYRFDQLQHFEIKADDKDYETEILLEPILDPHAVVVVDASGAPVIGADMFFVGDSGIEPLERSDNLGRVTLPPHRAGTVFAVPPAGSFGFARIAADVSEDVMLQTPAANGSMEIISQSADGQPIPDVFFIMRVNGMMIPPEVFARFASRHGMSFRTDRTGHAVLQLLPSGFYELWPVRSNNDVMGLFSGDIPQPAAAVALNGTPQIVTMTFKRKPSG